MARILWYLLLRGYLPKAYRGHEFCRLLGGRWLQKKSLDSMLVEEAGGMDGLVKSGHRVQPIGVWIV